MPYLTDRAAVRDADLLIDSFGSAAADEADARAARSRDIGNHIHFCRWRQVARLIDLLSLAQAPGTVH